QQANRLNPTTVHKWFDIVEDKIIKKGVLSENIFRMDESRFSLANNSIRYVIRARGKRIQYKQGGANRETVTAIITICTNSTYLKPVIIFKETNLPDRFTCSPNGWTDSEIALDWFQNQFEPSTRE
ncbi:uncharacterized protein FOMMEDRAFT_77288, partial [Fomitiporia mediterranea MF3/22]|uniref:uncharacterized protein n=1 Tax=Fomitiporia mediterranea (strain MF3/22) TaxID=694068 RepID=UPI000440780F